MKLFEISAKQPNQRYVFHETDARAAVLILKSGRIKGLWVDNPEAEKDMKDDFDEPDYGHYVYTSFMVDADMYYGVGHPSVMFVIDITKAPKGVYEPAEGGLYTIPKQVPLSAIVAVGIIDDVPESTVNQIGNLSKQNGIQFFSIVDRTKLINHFKRS